ncbi:guanylate kinase [Parascardovia denticolens DSM 10105 = JCM 12538]|uniref:Guanylate kinase n=2 Tax=Parascardovia denticolens TaxID=78258 RepID=E6K0P5_PARDN|nr:guanylate kinase [Parascardovia denticolens]EFG33001.1 guanylate kinase [Parascardovia denticolens F0305]EFT83376.1 guanylate kinase [Parascardovia denticolens DSM 10105 = JCM 12538]
MTEATMADQKAAQTGKRAGGKRKRRLVVLAGPTAVGKGTVEKAVKARHPELWISVSATSRPPRPGEVDGKDYHFVSKAEFERMIDQGELLEHAIVHRSDYYGTPLRPVLDHLNADLPSMLEIDVQGVHQVKVRSAELGLDPIYVFLAPPSFEDLRKRLAGRHTETPQQQERRLRTARQELALEGEFDRVIVNDQVEKAASQLWEILDQA